MTNRLPRDLHAQLYKYMHINEFKPSLKKISQIGKLIYHLDTNSKMLYSNRIQFNISLSANNLFKILRYMNEGNCTLKCDDDQEWTFNYSRPFFRI